MFFPDLSPYTYYSERPFPGVRNVGWLDSAHAFPIGRLALEPLNKLKTAMIGNEWLNVHVNEIRGVHPCNICGADIFPGDDLRIGSTEVWLPDPKGGFYASPSMIVHYIEVHDYYPPSEYIESIIKLDIEASFNAQDVYEDLSFSIISSD